MAKAAQEQAEGGERVREVSGHNTHTRAHTKENEAAIKIMGNRGSFKTREFWLVSGADSLPPSPLPRHHIQRYNRFSSFFLPPFSLLFWCSLVVYGKVLLLWALVLLSDYFVEFRFEYLWPFWLFLRSVYDSFKYQGLVSQLLRSVEDFHQKKKNCSMEKGLANFLPSVLPPQAFSVFFICIAVTSDMICYLFIPIHWLFFAASTYVWVQYVWHTGERTWGRGEEVT